MSVGMTVASDLTTISVAVEDASVVYQPLGWVGTYTDTTVFNTDGSITVTRSNGVVSTVTFPANGSVVETFAAPVSKVQTTSFTGSTITEVLA